MNGAGAGVVLLQAPPPKLDSIQKSVFDSGAREFLARLHVEFEGRIEQLYRARHRRNMAVHSTGTGFTFEFAKSAERLDKSWTIAPLPPRLQNRQLDLGDVSASDSAHFIKALKADVRAIQVDFDDGHCPSWRNQLLAYNNVMLAVHATHKLPGAPLDISSCPLLIFRPRAWNMIEHNILINGKVVPGALIDFGVHMYHNAVMLCTTSSGPYFYLPKLESASEAQLWNDIFVWTQAQLAIPQGTVKACVLIENVFSVFELDEILFALREHSLGLNCGIWDYCASIIAKLGDRKQFLLPDRNKYVVMERQFLRSYMRAVVSACHARGAPATGGMSAVALPRGTKIHFSQFKQSVLSVLKAKSKEVDMGVDGFMVYDICLVPYINDFWKKVMSTPNQIHRQFEANVSPKDLLSIPCGGATMKGLSHNVAVTILFVYHWLGGLGHYVYNMSVEDSATAEISRWQTWQWVRFGVPLEDDTKCVSGRLVELVAAVFLLDTHRQLCRSRADRKRLTDARHLSTELFLTPHPPEFITTYLNDKLKGRTLNDKENVCRL